MTDTSTEKLEIPVSLRKSLSDALVLVARDHLIAEIRLTAEGFELELIKRGQKEPLPAYGEIKKELIVLNYEEEKK